MPMKSSLLPSCLSLHPNHVLSVPHTFILLKYPHLVSHLWRWYHSYYQGNVPVTRGTHDPHRVQTQLLPSFQGDPLQSLSPSPCLYQTLSFYLHLKYLTEVQNCDPWIWGYTNVVIYPDPWVFTPSPSKAYSIWCSKQIMIYKQVHLSPLRGTLSSKLAVCFIRVPLLCLDNFFKLAKLSKRFR